MWVPHLPHRALLLQRVEGARPYWRQPFLSAVTEITWCFLVRCHQADKILRELCALPASTGFTFRYYAPSSCPCRRLETRLALRNCTFTNNTVVDPWAWPGTTPVPGVRRREELSIVQYAYLDMGYGGSVYGKAARLYLEDNTFTYNSAKIGECVLGQFQRRSWQH